MHNRSEIIFFVSVVLCVKIAPILADFQQQGAKVVYYNTKYIKSVSIFTTRVTRTSPYSTDLNITSVASWGNNVTVKIQYYKMKLKSEALAIEFKTCDMIKLKWAKDWIEKYSNLTVDCPLRVGIYRFSGFEIPPKNFPVFVLEKNTDYKTKFLVYVTKTKEAVLEIDVDLKFETKSKYRRI